MEKQENEKYRAVNFDLSKKKLEKYFSATNPKGAYHKIYNFFVKNNFEHRQHSGYRSKESMTDTEIMNLMDELFTKMPWLDKCAEKMDITNIDSIYDVLKIRESRRAKEKRLSKDTKSRSLSLKKNKDNRIKKQSVAKLLAEKKEIVEKQKKQVSKNPKSKSHNQEL